MLNLNIVIVNVISEKMSIYGNVFCASLEDKIGGEISGIEIVIVYGRNS